MLSVVDLGALSSQLDAIELTSFSGGQLTEIQGAQTALRSARDGLVKLIPGIRSTLSRPGPYVKTAFAGVLASLVANDVVMQALIYYGGSPTKASQAAKPPTPASPSASPSSEPGSWMFNTRVGTSKKTFDKFIKSLPDKGSGRQIIYPSMDYQWYVTRMTREEALVVHRAPIVDQLVPNRQTRMEPAFRRGNATTDKYLAPRDPGDLTLTSWFGADPSLKQISWYVDRPLPPINWNNPLWTYLHDQSKGEGTFIYVFDGKINWNHRVSHPCSQFLHCFYLSVLLAMLRAWLHTLLAFQPNYQVLREALGIPRPAGQSHLRSKGFLRAWWRRYDQSFRFGGSWLQCRFQGCRQGLRRRIESQYYQRCYNHR